MSTRLPRQVSLAAALVALLFGLLWQSSALRPVFAIAHLSDPAKLGTLGERGANSRLNKIVYWLDQARNHGLAPGKAITLSQFINHTTEPRASLVRESLLRNLQIAGELGLWTAENRDRLRHGKAGIITRGPYAHSTVEIDHIVPYSLAKEAGNELANLEMLPEPLNRQKSNHVGDRQVAHARRLYEARLLTKESLDRVERQSMASGSLRHVNHPEDAESVRHHAETR